MVTGLDLDNKILASNLAGCGIHLMTGQYFIAESFIITLQSS